MSLLSSIVFYALAAVAVGSALWVVTARNVFHSALALTVTLSAVAALFALMGADFLAASQILVYVGGVMIIMLFVVMLSQQPLDALRRQTNEQWLWGALFAIAVACALILHFGEAYKSITEAAPLAPTSAAIGKLLLGDMVIPFEAVSLVLLAALVGAVLFGSDPMKE